MRLRTLVVALVVGVVACDSGPRGPGTLVGRVTAPELGGVLLEVEGRGIEAFTARGTARVYSAARADRPGTHRVLLVDPEGGEIVFEIDVTDRGMEGPVVTVISATDTANRVRSPSSVVVRVER